MLKIGIDPGVGGAWVALVDGQPVEWGRMPTMKLATATRVNAAELAALLRGFTGSGVGAYLENVAAMPGQGVSSMFSFGHAAGVAAGVLATLAIPVTLVQPATWKRRAGLAGSEKDAARARAIQLWPSWRALDKKGEGQALADAALIALYGDVEAN